MTVNKLNTIKDVEIIEFQNIKSRHATLNVFSDIHKYFTVKRIFSVSSKLIKNDIRGFHAHKKCKQIITCPFGEIKFSVFDGKKKIEFKIGNNKAIYVPNHIWTETTYLKKNTIVVCYCSDNYNESSYIRDLDQYIQFRDLNTKKN